MGTEPKDTALHGRLESLPDSYFHCIAANLKAQTFQGQRTAFHEIASETQHKSGMLDFNLWISSWPWGSGGDCAWHRVGITVGGWENGIWFWVL